MNLGFKTVQKRLVFPIVVINETIKKEKVNENRDYAIEAAIIKVLKARKIVKYNDLINEVSILLK